MSRVAVTHPSDRASRARRLVLGLLCLALVLLAGWYVGYLRQPRYQGVTLNGWLREFPRAWDTSIFADPRGIPTQAVAAVKSIGPAAVPELMKRLRREDSAFKLRVNEWLEKQSVVEWRFAERRQDQLVALLAFQALGDRGARAVPELTAMLGQPSTVERAERALTALGCIGQPAVPVLLRMLAHTNSAIRFGAVNALSMIAPVTPDALDGVLPLVEDTDPRVRQCAVYYVGGATNHLRRTLPVLVAKLKDTDEKVRRAAITSFKRAGDRGRECIPNLMALLCDNPSRSDFAISHQELKALGAPTDMLIPCLIRALDSSDELVRSRAARLLSTYGSDAQAALPRLRQIIEQISDAAESARFLEAAAKIESPEKVGGDYATNFPPRRPPSRSR